MEQGFQGRMLVKLEFMVYLKVGSLLEPDLNGFFFIQYD